MNEPRTFQKQDSVQYIPSYACPLEATAITTQHYGRNCTTGPYFNVDHSRAMGLFLLPAATSLVACSANPIFEPHSIYIYRLGQEPSALNTQYVSNSGFTRTKFYTHTRGY
jgi:hypothetical protein